MSDDIVIVMPHELEGKSVAFDLPQAGAAGQVQVWKGGKPAGAAALTEPLAVQGATGTLSLAALQALRPGDGPFFLRGPEVPKTLAQRVKEKLAKELDPFDGAKKIKGAQGQGKFALNFGKDKLMIALSGEAGVGGAGTGGGGAGYIGGVSIGQGVAVTGNVKPYSVTPVFEVGTLLQSEESLVIALRFIIRYFYHWCDALNLSVDHFRKLPKGGSPEDFATGFLGYNWWMFIFSMFAFKDACYDLVNDHADFIAEVLQKIGVELKMDVSAAANVAIEVTGTANLTMAGKCYIPLGVVLAPFIEFLMAGSSVPPPPGGTLADKIVPFIEGVVEDRLVVQLGAMPAMFEVESRGQTAKATFAVPKGSPLRKKIEKLGEDIGKAADTYKKNKLKTLPDEMAIPRLVLDLIDKEIRTMIKLVKAGKKLYDVAKDGQVKEGELGEAAGGAKEGADALNEAFTTAAPYVKRIMDALRGKKVEEPAGISPAAQAVIDAVKETKVRGVAVGVNPPCEVAESGERKQVSIYADDAERKKLEAHITPKSADAVLESVTFKVGLPAKPAAIAWDHFRDLDRGREYAGIVAGFDDKGSLAALNGRRGGNWVPPELTATEWDREGKHWGWVEVGLSAWAAGRKLPVPEIALDDAGALLVTFDELPVGTITDAVKGEVPVLAQATSDRRTISRLVLMDQATTEEAEAIEAEIDRNQPDDDPYATPWLDEVIANAGRMGGPEQGGGPLGDLFGAFRRLGGAYQGGGPLPKLEGLLPGLNGLLPKPPGGIPAPPLPFPPPPPPPPPPPFGLPRLG